MKEDSRNEKHVFKLDVTSLNWSLCILLTVSVFFSTLSWVKKDLRNDLSNKMLNHLVMISIEGPAPSDFLLCIPVGRHIHDYCCSFVISLYKYVWYILYCSSSVISGCM